MEITLLDYQERAVGKFIIQPYISEPDVLTWGYRTFKRVSEKTYKECFNAAVPCGWVPISLRFGDPAVLINSLAEKVYNAENTATGEVSKWTIVDESVKRVYRDIAAAVLDEAVKAFSAEWITGADGSKLLQFNEAAV